MGWVSRALFIWIMVRVLWHGSAEKHQELVVSAFQGCSGVGVVGSYKWVAF